MRWLIVPLASGLAAVATAAPAPAVQVVGCAQRAEPGDPPPTAKEVREARRASIVMRYVTLWGVRRARGYSFRPRRNGWKAGLSVRGSRPVTVSVAARDRSWLSLNYALGPAPTRVADGDPAVRFVPCPRGTLRFSDGRPLGAETGWAGGFVVARPGCATLLVRRGGAGQATHVRIGFGVACR